MSTSERGRHVRDFLLGGFATYGALWLVIESISAFFASLKPGGLAGYSALLFLAVIGDFGMLGRQSGLSSRFRRRTHGSRSGSETFSKVKGLSLFPSTSTSMESLEITYRKTACMVSSLGMYWAGNRRLSWN